MAEQDREELKPGAPQRPPNEAGPFKPVLLLGFLAICVALIVLIWADNLAGAPGGQGFVRATSIIVTLEPGATFPPHEEHKNRNNEPTPSAAATLVPNTALPPALATPTPTRDSSDIGLTSGGAAYLPSGGRP